MTKRKSVKKILEFIPDTLSRIPSLTGKFTRLRILDWRMKDRDAKVSILFAFGMKREN